MLLRFGFWDIGSEALRRDLSAADRAQLEVEQGELVATLLASNPMAGKRIPHVSFCNCRGERQREAFANMIGHSDEKLELEARPVVRLARITLQILTYQSRVSFINFT